MNKKQYNRIVNLYRDGVGEQVCITSIMQMSESDFEASTFISRFFNEMLIAPAIEENHTLRLELKQWQELEERLAEITEEMENESSNRAKPTDLGDQRRD